jgi:hypothetical protein
MNKGLCSAGAPGPASIEVEFVAGGGHEQGSLEGMLLQGRQGGIAAVKIVRVQGKVEGYLAGLAPGDIVYISRGSGWVLRREPGGKLVLVPGSGAGEEGQGIVAAVGVAGIMRKMV